MRFRAPSGLSPLTAQVTHGDRSTRGRFSGSSEDPLNGPPITLPSTLVLHRNEKHKMQQKQFADLRGRGPVGSYCPPKQSGDLNELKELSIVRAHCPSSPCERARLLPHTGTREPCCTQSQSLAESKAVIPWNCRA
ncbi:hypothetical protein UY3_10305 [Chelonia mydas]|uniref:Uncharacterized protein n=1 Tax=Chelonia mydas TaxID=8469 RepID=M7B3T5_CHEMY|nr:hypothetical protein UY3_10305 [Chelonia mydas]